MSPKEEGTLNSERKSFVAYIATAALLLSSLTAVFAAPLSNVGTAAAATATITAALPSVGINSTAETISGSGFAATATVTLSFDPASLIAPFTATTDGNGNFTSRPITAPGAAQ